MFNVTINNTTRNTIIKSDRSNGINMLCNLIILFLLSSAGGLLNLFQEMNRTYLLANLLTYGIIKSQNKSMI